MNGRALRVEVDPLRCEGHAQCFEMAPELFDLNSDDVAEVVTKFPDEDQWPAARAAAAACPRQAILIASIEIDR